MPADDVIGTGQYAWRFALRGSQHVSGNLRRDFEEEGVVRGENGEHAALNLASSPSPLWDCLDTDEPFSIEFEPATDLDEPDDVEPASSTPEAQR